MIGEQLFCLNLLFSFKYKNYICLLIILKISHFLVVLKIKFSKKIVKNGVIDLLQVLLILIDQLLHLSALLGSSNCIDLLKQMSLYGRIQFSINISIFQFGSYFKNKLCLPSRMSLARSMNR